MKHGTVCTATISLFLGLSWLGGCRGVNAEKASEPPPEVAEAAQEKPAEPPKEPLPQVLLKTSRGEILIELYEDEAPNTVANFISLVEKGFYDGTKFHRVLEGFMAQGGDPTGTGTGSPGYRIRCECYQRKRKKHERAAVSMANAGKDTGGSQFFIMFARKPELDGKHTVFGRVIKGMNVADRFTRVDPEFPIVGVKPDVIEEATVIRKRDHEYKPEKI
jgi:cyclophilin family peptidyl-prolyl cis-trans isomerase